MPKVLQVAALPWRQGEHGVEILLVTTRTTKRWLIPKGWTMAGKADHEAAAQEAFEEAGVRGRADVLPIAHYGYLKALQNGKQRRVQVQVFALPVTEVLSTWPEQQERERQWLPPLDALRIIGEPELLPIIADFAKASHSAIPKAGDQPSLLDSFLTVVSRWFRT
jgi:8-oxo-dGTP pyrophosphatase MutT (NUDIX family)